MKSLFALETPSVISFSGGRTSGLMLYRILEAYGFKLPDGIKVIFCNTGKERAETLDFVERCSQEWGVDITWLEYRYTGPVMEPVPEPTTGKWVDRERTMWSPLEDLDGTADDDEQHEIGTYIERVWIPDKKTPKRVTPGSHGFTVVNYATASRNGEPFEQLIRARNMLPNVVARFCTVELKIRTNARYLKSIGWTDGYLNAIGLRADEPHRVARLKGTNRHNAEEPIAPLYAAGVTLADVQGFWKKQPFDLQLEPYEGNCDLCFLKGAGKIRRIMQEHPELAEWWMHMETIIDSGRNGIGRFRADRPPYRVQLELAKRPGLFDEIEEHDQLSAYCSCTD